MQTIGDMQSKYISNAYRLHYLSAKGQAIMNNYKFFLAALSAEILSLIAFDVYIVSGIITKLLHGAPL